MKKIETTIGILVVIGLALGIGFGVYQTHDGKSLREFAAMYASMREELQAAKADAREARNELAHYKDYIFGKLEAP
jgi:predicted negative regulator of RcsB-dependent stress response